MNLLNNAFEYTPAGGHVWLRAQRDDGRVLIEVEDECGGIPESKTDPFKPSPTAASKDRTGLGLGLSIARKAVSDAWWGYRLPQPAGKGCVFVIDPPLPAKTRLVRAARGTTRRNRRNGDGNVCRASPHRVRWKSPPDPARCIDDIFENRLASLAVLEDGRRIELFSFTYFMSACLSPRISSDERWITDARSSSRNTRESRKLEMAPKNDVRAALGDMTSRSEQHSIELRRLRRHVELSVRRTADLQALSIACSSPLSEPNAPLPKSSSVRSLFRRNAELIDTLDW